MTRQDRNSVYLAHLARMVLAASLLWALAACGTSGGGDGDVVADTGEPDVVQVVDVTPDVPIVPDVSEDVPPEIVEGQFGDPCEAAEDCESGYCVPGPEGTLACSDVCDDDCPEDWECRTAWAGTLDVTALCLGPTQQLCAPCESHDDCDNPGDRCVAVGPAGETFCTIGCGRAGLCPTDYTCTPIDAGAGITLNQCLPDTDSCICTPELDGTERDCEQVSAHGNCAGTQTCNGTDGWSECDAPIPVAELCDNIDNDCDGDTDEGFRYEELDGTRVPIGMACGLGLCEGTVVCADEANATCSGLEAQSPETCDGIDNDCDGETDEYDDCAPAGCGVSGTGYAERSDATCQEGSCQGANESGCGAYTCELGGAAGDLCATTCLDDNTCRYGYHCDVASGACVADVTNGGACASDGDCQSRHCRNAVCCGQGDCCAGDADCPASYGAPAVCKEPWRCQGERVDAVCNLDTNICERLVVADDSACDADVVAVDCHPFVARTCNGEAEQGEPGCLATCSDDTLCLPGYHCDGVCVADRPDGVACDEDSDCVSGYCNAGLCCAAGDCCLSADDCPASYTAEPTCDDADSCQGHRTDATCVDHVCQGLEVDDDTACDDTLAALDCGDYVSPLCSGDAEQTMRACPASCATDDECVESARCWVGECSPDVGIGEACLDDGHCAEGACRNGFCCEGAACCAAAADCPDDYRVLPVCDDAATCQGHRIDAECVDNICVMGGTPVDDDSGCTAETVADECGDFVEALCTGETEQTAPECPTVCSEDDDCDAGTHCDDEQCVADVAAGTACDEDSDCAAGVCSNGFCCAGGDCCVLADDCPASYTAEAVCLDSFACQGVRYDATCVDNVCGTLLVEDDSACTAETMANECGRFPAAWCTGAAEQVRPVCPAVCATDEDCDEGSTCSDTYLCVGAEDEGATCGEDADCASGHCENGYCCGFGTCCATSADCAVEAVAADCTVADTCQGQRGEAWCDASSECAVAVVDDDSACGAEQVVEDCAPYADRTCTGAWFQEGGACPETCVGDEDCDAEANCVDDACVPKPVAGEPCGEPANCASGLQCVDGVCCTSACDGLCERCDVAGAEGTCTPVPADSDPDEECLALVCDGWYAGWEGATCFTAADASDEQVFCDGAGACQMAADVCPFTGPDSEETSCPGVCETPDEATCAGEVAGTCGTADLGEISCGTGACLVTVPRCVDGAENSCVPGLPTLEDCNGLDDDCDGRTDEVGGDGGDAGLIETGTPLCEMQEGVCGGAEKPLYLCQSGTWLPCGADAYLQGNTAYEPNEELSCDGLDNDCDGVTDDDFANDVNNCGACDQVCRNAYGSTACEDGVCVPTCDAEHADCDDDRTNGCETSTREESNCGACGRTCAIEGAVASCETGSCALVECEYGRVDCNDSLEDGCETTVFAPATCLDDTEYLGESCADLSIGNSCISNCQELMAKQAGHADAWFRVRAKECSSCDADIRLWMRLDVPDDANYDLRVYEADCPGADTPPVAQGLSGTGEDEIVTVSSTDRPGADETTEYWIEVVWLTGSTCDGWTFEVFAGCAEDAFAEDGE